VAAYRGGMHVARNRRGYVTTSGEERVYETILLRRSVRDGAKVRHETLGNLSKLPPELVAAIEAATKGQTLIAAGSEFSKARSLPHGDVAGGAAMARKLERAPRVPGPRHRHRLNHLPGGAAKVEAVPPGLVAEYPPRRRPRGHRRIHRRDLRRDGLAGRPSGQA